METYRKNSQVITEPQAQDLLTAQDDFYDNPVIGKPSPQLDSHLLKIWNGGEHLSWDWSSENQSEYDQRIAIETAAAAKESQLDSDMDFFLDTRIRPWRDQKLREWIDETYIKPLLYPLDSGQITERINIRQTLLDWPASCHLAVASITRSGTTATATISGGHSLNIDDWVFVEDAVQSEYNGLYQITAVSGDTFDYEISGSPSSPATGTIELCFLTNKATDTEIDDLKPDAPSWIV